MWSHRFTELKLQYWIIDQKSTWMFWRYLNCQNWTVETIQNIAGMVVTWWAVQKCCTNMMIISVFCCNYESLKCLLVQLILIARVNRVWSCKLSMIWRSDVDRRSRVSRGWVLGPLHIKRKGKQTGIPWCYCGSNILLKN